ncbi:MAG: family 43 glycosylhydrolase, partial [Bacteroidetes bacterium]|nr:family 43 glycosylhydrolase [Bacteroidota bacterium]
VSQTTVPWAKPDAYSMWAPDCIQKNGKYYFYFPTAPKDSAYGRGFAIGVAIADKPSGPFIPEAEPVKGVHGIDPNVFIDNNGQAYLYWAGGNIYVAKLKDNMLELDSAPTVIENLPVKGLKEGPYLFERNNIYYLTYPHVADKREQLEYATSNSPMGPFKVTGVIMDEFPDCWTNHQSIIQWKDQWYLFYHHNDLSPNFDKNRSVRIDSLFFNEDGTIKKVIPTLRGVGITKATNEIQVDRYSEISSDGVSVEFIDTMNHFGGWKTIFNKAGGWLRYNSIDFGNKKLKTFVAKARSESGGILQVRLDKPGNPLIATIRIPPGKEWQSIKTSLLFYQPGIHNLVLSCGDTSAFEIDWVRFD